MPDVIHDTGQHTNNRAELSHQPTRVRERGMRGAAFRRFKSVGQAQRFLGIHAAVDFLGREITFFFVCRDLVLAAIFAFAGGYRQVNFSGLQKWRN